jgi:uncharacterized protein YjcR
MAQIAVADEGDEEAGNEEAGNEEAGNEEAGNKKAVVVHIAVLEKE